MKSSTLPSFWESYDQLDEATQRRARRSYELWERNPFHPSLRFKCVNSAESIWSVRITRSYRAVGILEGNEVTWFWVGGHDDYERFFS